MPAFLVDWEHWFSFIFCNEFPISFSHKEICHSKLPCLEVVLVKLFSDNLWKGIRRHDRTLQNIMSLQKAQLQPHKANLQNWRKWYLTTQSLPSDDFASIGNKDDSVTPNISAHKHTMQFLWQLFTDLQNSGRTAKTGPFSECVRLSACGELPPPKRVPKWPRIRKF